MVNVYFDSIISPFYSFGGLSLGNLNSMSSKDFVSNPKKAALDGLNKMKVIYDLGQIQYILPPVRKDYEYILNTYSKEKNLNDLLINSPEIFRAIFSSAGTWLANSWTQINSIDTVNNIIYLRVSNLASMMHRKMDIPYTKDLLNDLFKFSDRFILIDCLEPSIYDEGLANLIRLSSKQNEGLYIGVYGSNNTSIFNSRHHKQTWEKLYQDNILIKNKIILAEQNPFAIDSGVFHNDVISFGIDSLLVLHEYTFSNQKQVIDIFKDRFYKLFQEELVVVEIPNTLLDISNVLNLYFFNSQIIKTGSNQYTLVCPSRCQNNAHISDCLKFINSFLISPINIKFVDLEESIKNGGGPACLRNVGFFLKNELDYINKKYIFTPLLYSRLVQFISKNYPDKLSINELTDIKLVRYLNEINKSLFNMF